MEVRWLSGSFPNYPHIRILFASEPISNSPPTYTSSTVPTHSIHLILQDSVDFTCTLHRDPPTPSLLHAKFVAVRDNMFRYSGNGTRTFMVGVRRHNHHATNQLNFTDSLIPLPQSRTDFGHIPLFQLLQNTFFSVPPRPDIQPYLSTR